MNSLLRPLDAFSISPRAVAPTCYVNTLSKIRSNPDFEPCGGSSDAGAFCCHKDDICLEDSICHFTSTQIVQGTSGYYVGGCTDETYNDPACSRSCSESPRIYRGLSRWESYIPFGRRIPNTGYHLQQQFERVGLLLYRRELASGLLQARQSYL